ncbi:hypothetical protein ASPWEDRAFT_180297 [Aspergillus wentii DTO 134E9]|uniref:Uncharacterized protein n=1 Tax=Aspergillus wentii DTO 134E9 TaxID=1073089 RepID=A0A1L9RVD3_ASPWE|nr:uncharacterized protein ASPWEDRAFT_180297 [Aspergillus wentii DTO 134E9]KAI9928725.1 hypothetical protein MW887_001942 [Aspergillus wentii]OJJ38818.1 hypothetical protein ASPWEDRAFT_180297 [Aspergillus wentii DTO 134E9]
MAEKSFFTRSFIGRNIVFGSSRPSTWTLTEKLSEEVFQKDRISSQNSGIISVSHGTFHCRNVHDHSDTAMIKIIMQIPYAASELEYSQYRAQQASNEVPFLEQWEIDARKKLAINKCTSTHTLHNVKFETQGTNGSVPGGFIVYMRLEAVP